MSETVAEPPGGVALDTSSGPPGSEDRETGEWGDNVPRIPTGPKSSREHVWELVRG